MSHGGGGNDKAAEPNLTPLLDVVMQLVMFFMMCANFVMEQVNEDIRLPIAQSARPMDKSETDVRYLNVDHEGRVLISGREPLITPAEIKLYLQQEASDIKELERAKGGSGTDLKTMLVIRAHKDTDFSRVYGVMRLGKDVGFRRLQLRAIIESTRPG